MPKIAYIEKKFQAKTLEIISLANEIIEEYQAQGMDLSLRQLYYQFVARGYLPNRKKEYDRLGDIIGDARLAGLIDWSAIEDRTRELKQLNHYSDPGEIIRLASRWFRLDHWEGQEYRPEVWIEKNALIGVISGICNELDVAHYACIGYVSLSEMWRASERYEDMNAIDQKPIIIHLGDHDPSGMDMTRDISDRQDIFSFDSVEVIRIALNMNQVEEHNPPPNPAKLTDSRAPDYIRRYGPDSWELDALDPITLRNLIEDHVLSYRDDTIYEEVLYREREYQRTLENIEENWESL